MSENKTVINTDNLIRHLNEKWKNQPCQMCGSKNWTVSDKVFELREFHGGDLVLGPGPIQPIVPVTCTNCGNSLLVNALISGAIERPTKEESKSEKQ